MIKFLKILSCWFGFHDYLSLDVGLGAYWARCSRCGHEESCSNRN